MDRNTTTPNLRVRSSVKAGKRPADDNPMGHTGTNHNETVLTRWRTATTA
ncbi:MAG: hypothetical protein ACK5AZ_05870 [Bryobacteraceae bacterium]